MPIRKIELTNLFQNHIIVIAFGPVAQLGERRVRIAEVEGSNPFGSTILFR